MALTIWLPLTKDLRNQGTNNGTITNSGATYSATNGKLGGCYILDGSDDAIGIGNLSTLVDTEFTFACWFYHDDTWSSKSWETILGGPSGFELEMKNSTTNSPCVYLYSWGKGNFTYDLNKWNHLVMTRTTSETKYYLNGELKLTGSAGTIPSGDYFIGSWKNSTSQNFKGQICDVRIYDNCLSAEEVKTISKGLVLHYQLSDKYIESTENWLESRSTSMTGWSSYGFGTHATITTTSEIEPAITGAEVALVTQKTSNVTNTACEIATPVYTATTKSTIQNKGEKFTFSAYVKGKGATIGKQIQIHIYNTNGTNTISKGDSSFRLTDEWQRISYTHEWTYDTASTNSLNVYVVGYISTGESFYMSNPQVEKKDHMTPWVAMERAATTVYDCSGFNNNGTIAGTLTYTSDTPKYEASTIFSENPANYIVTTGLKQQVFTWTCWFKVLGAVEKSYQFILSEGRDMGSVGTNICTSKAGTGLYLDSHGIRSSTATISLNEWYHVALVCDGSQMSFYLNGQLIQSKAYTAETDYAQSNDAFVIGKMSYAYTNTTVYFPFNGQISDVRIYATALSASDVKSLYQNEAYIDSNGVAYGAIR